MLLKLCLLIICLFRFEVRSEAVGAPCDMLVIIIIEPFQHLSYLIRVKLVQQVIYHYHAYLVSIMADPLSGWRGNTIFFSQERNQLCLGHRPEQFVWLASNIT